jgi:mannitol-specific phosphotransferase system IIBC component
MTTIDAKDIHKLVIACDAGMGSSVMLASQLRKKLKGLDVNVEHTPVNTVPADADVVLCHAALAERARVSAPGKVVVEFQVFIGDPAVAGVVDAIRNGGTVNG